MSNLTFKVVGTSILNGVCKIRFSNDLLRGNVLLKNGHTEVKLVEIIPPLSKLEAAKSILNYPLFQDVESKQAIEEFIKDFE